MPRCTLAFGLLLATSACSGTDVGPAARPAERVLVEHAGGDPFSPSISPDGTRLAWSMPVEGQSAIFVANIDGSNPVQLTHGVWDSAPHWSPDGRWIAYHAESPDFDIFAVASGGGEPRQLTSGPAIDYPWYWLPDGSAIVFTREGAGPLQTLAVPIDGGPARLLAPADGGNRAVAVSPDGARAAIEVVQAGGGTIWLQDEAGEERQLTKEGMETLSDYPWSPDGRLVLYESLRTGTRDVWVADVETGDLRQLTTDIHNDQEARWSPDGRWVAFQSDRGGQSDLWIVAATGGQPHRVTDDLALELDHEWSPDGRTLVFTSVFNTAQLQMLPLDGGPARELVTWSGYGIENVDISADGSTVVFQSDRSGNNDLWSIPVAGDEPMPLTTSPVDDEEPRFSPDGQTLVFHSRMAGTGDLWLMPAAGGEARPLTNWSSNESGARWSPDGNMIAFVSNRDADQNEVWIIPATGGEARRLTAGRGNAENLHWSPDGSALYFIGPTASGTRDLYRVALDGGEPIRLEASPAIGNGDLSPDGSQFAYASFETGWGFIEVVPTAGGPVRRLTSGTERVFQNWALWSPDGERLVVVDYDYPEDTYDLQVVTWPEGEWRPLTNTPRATERVAAFTPDGTQALVIMQTRVVRIMAASVSDLLADTARR